MIRLLTALLLFASFNVVADVTLPNNLQENSVASATDVMDNFNALASEVNSQDSRITIVEQSVGGGTTTRTFTFSNFVSDVGIAPCGDVPVCLASINDANIVCNVSFGSKYGAASLDVVAEALKYHEMMVFPSAGECGIVIKQYTSASETWYQFLEPRSGALYSSGDSCSYEGTLMCGYWD